MIKLYINSKLAAETERETAQLIARFLSGRPGWDVVEACEVGMVCIWRNN